MAHSIVTVGYEGTTIEAFITALKRSSITLLIDVREMPLSRKKGFSKNQLASILRSFGIEYVHLRGLGDPKPGREAARAGNYPLFRKIFGAHLCTEAARNDLARAQTLVQENTACLMCFEADASQCHRTIVAQELAQMTGLTVKPMVVHNLAMGELAA